MSKYWGALLILFSCSQEQEEILKPVSDALSLSSYTLSGVVIDYENYLNEVTVCIDETKNLKCDPEELQTKTSVDGSFSLSLDGVSELNLLAEVKGQDNYNLTSNLAECSYGEKSVEGLCELNITPFTNYLALTKVADNTKTYADLRVSALAIFSRYVEGFDDVDLDYIKSPDINLSLGLAESDAFKAFKILARILVNVAVSSNLNASENTVSAERLQENVFELVKSVDLVFQEIESQNLQILDLGSDLQVIDRIIASVMVDELEKAIDTDNNLESQQVIESLDNASAGDQPGPLQEVELAVSAVAAFIPELPQPNINLFDNTQQSDFFVLKDNPVKVEITDYDDTFIKFQNDHSSTAISLGLSDSLVVKIYTNTSCTTLVPSSPVDGSPGVLEIDFSQLANKTTQVYSQIEFADKKSVCSPMSPKIVAYSLDNPSFICNNATYMLGSGASAADPKIICNTNDFKIIRNFLDNHFFLTTDIDLTPPQVEDTDNYDADGWIPIPDFTGSLEGNGHKITGLSINRPSEDEQGLFARISSGASVSNLILGEPQAEQKSCNHNLSDANNNYLGCDIVFASEGGALVGVVMIGDEDTSISNIVNNYSIYATSNFSGGVIGRVTYFNSQETGGFILNNLLNNQSVSGSSRVGGVLSFLNSSSNRSITGTKLVNTGDIWSLTGTAGGVAGGVSAYENVIFEELENSGTVNSEGDNTGGIFGDIYGVNIGKIKNTGKVISSNNIAGGIAGNANSSTINYAWNSAKIIAKDKVGGIIGKGNTVVLNDARNSGNILTHTNEGYDIGGIIGLSQNSTYQKLFNSGVLTGKVRVGGIIGSASNETLTYVINHGYVTGTNSLGGIIAGVSSGDIILSSAHNAGTVAAKSWKLGGILGYYYGYNEIRKFIDILITAGLQGSYNVGDSTHMGGFSGSINENGVADPGIDLAMLSMERVLNLNSSYHDTSPPETFGIMFGSAGYWGGTILKRDIWAGTSQFSAEELPSPAPKMSAYGVKANLAPITNNSDPDSFGTNTLMLCIDADDSDSDGDVCTHANPISAADFYSDSTIGLDSSSNWKLGPAIFSESIALGDGSTESFTAILQLDSIAVGSVKIQFIHNGAVRTALDDGLGNFNADWLGASTIDYNTGEVNLQFNSGEAPEDNEAISIQYTSVASVPILNFTWDWEDNPNTFPWSGTLIP